MTTSILPPLLRAIWFANVQGRHGWNRVRGVLSTPALVVQALVARRELQAFHERMCACGAEAEFVRPANPMGMVVWPYMNWRWPRHKRFATVLDHYEIAQEFPAWLQLKYGSSLQLADLSAHSPGVRLVLDRAPWFMSEGEWVLNLFVDEVRAMSVAFCMGRDGQRRVLKVGAIQGVHSGVDPEQRMALLKRLTKDFESQRPRSLLMHLVRTFARHTGAHSLLCVANADRMHHHPYFGKSHPAIEASANYDEIWEELGAQQRADGFFEIAVDAPARDLADVPSRKRAQYRRRLEMLDQIDGLLGEHFAKVGPVPNAPRDVSTAVRAAVVMLTGAGSSFGANPAAFGLG